jgi:hypothetical protein
MMVKMLLEMLYQKSASESAPVSLLALKPRAKGTVAMIRVRRTSVTRRRGSVVGDCVVMLVGFWKGFVDNSAHMFSSFHCDADDGGVQTVCSTKRCGRCGKDTVDNTVIVVSIGDHTICKAV